MPWWLTTLALYAGSVVVSALLSKVNKPENVPGKPQFPTADPNRPIPVVYGKTRIGMNVVHKANLRLGENTVRGAAPFGWSPQHIGYFYYLDLLAVLCWGTVDALWDIIVDGDISLADAGNVRIPSLDALGVTYTTPPAMNFFLSPLVGEQATITVSAGSILGGKFSRGGVGAGNDAGAGSGTIILHSGDGTVIQDTRLETLEGGDLPCYPRLATVRFGPDFYFGNSENLPSFEFIVSRTVAPFGGTGYIGNVTANAGADALPGGICYDLLTNPLYGEGLPAEDIDDGAFEAVNNACDSNFGGAFDCGLSFAITEQVTGKEILSDLMRTLDGVLYTHPTTGKLTVTLLRAPDDPDFGIAGAPTIDESMIVEDSFVWTDSAADATVNEVRVEFPDKERKFTTNVATVRNVAAIQELGRVESRTVRFLGVTNADLAYRLAQRELKALSTSLGHASFEADRSGAVYTPGQFFYLDYSPRSLSQRVMRVVSVRDTPAGKVAIDAVEDVYSSAAPSFTPYTPEEPAPPAAQPFQAPYVEEVATQTTTTGTLKLFVYDPQGVVTSVEFQSTSGAGTPSGYTTDAYPYAKTVTLDPYATSTIDYVVNYTDQNGDPATLEGTVTFGVNSSAAESAAGAVTATVGSVGIPTVFLTVPENDQWLALSTIPTTAVEVGTEYRRQRYLVGAGSVRLHANVKAITGTPTLRLYYTTNAFGATTQLVSWTPGGTGLQSSAWFAMPTGAKADVGLTLYVGDGADTAALDLYAVDAEFLPATVTGGRVHDAAHAPEFY